MLDYLKKSYWIATFVLVMSAILKYEEWLVKYSDYSVTDMFIGLLISWTIHFVFGVIFISIMSKMHVIIMRKKG